MYHQSATALAQGDVKGADLSPANQALLAYAEKLTCEPSAISDADIAALREHGFDDAQLWEATLTASFFNLLTRMADAFGIVPPPPMAALVGLDD